MPSRLPSLRWRPVLPRIAGEAARRLPSAAPVSEGLFRAIERTGLPGFDDDPPPLEYASRLLAIAAQVEQEFLLQYLYAAYSLPARHPWRETLVLMAKEEMGHFLTVQNLLRSIGREPVFELEPSPPPSDWYPFAASREPFTASTLARYLVAESPAEATLPPELPSPGQTPRHVGVIYATLYWLFLGDHDPDHGPWPGFPADMFAGLGHLPSGAVGGGGNQVGSGEWGSPTVGLIQSGTARLIVADVADSDAALRTLYQVTGQGEGLNEPDTRTPSHYRRLLDMYAASRRPDAPPFASGIIANPVLTGPPDDPGLITAAATRPWAELVPVRYRLLLLELAQGFTFAPGETIGSDPVRELLFQDWVRTEMDNLRALSEKLVTLPAREGAAEPRAGPPFLPSGPLPAGRADAWKLHRELIARTEEILRTVPADSLAEQLRQADAARLAWLEQNGL